MAKKKYKTGLVLSGGGARGFAHLGAIQALHEAGIYPDVISGVSAGAIVGAFYAYGMSPEDTLDLLKEKGLFDYSKFNFPLNGLLSLKGLIKEVKDNIPCEDISELSKPAFFAATNLNKGTIEYHNKGNLCNVVAASACIPILFSPIEVDGALYIDGGTFDNLPVTPIMNDCEQIIAINISPIRPVKELNSMLQIAARVFQLSVNATVVKSLDHCDLVIAPDQLADYSILDSSVADEVYKIGYEEAKKELSKLST
ncbi:patatin-like phospholipase family protein [Marinoscillum furvescens]|uniref:NTE family protein n=1 Tax=Marinoscillum furvescens DSM 4134 TaxID=1122208 RepID=A0A3D9L2Q0_MARFU|nr:patatin-like phospholipase family protein [Marinoscillum furvescens]RED97967.1 NTE family protein [Marinoscillum furvescens DSM 4134]